MKYSSNWKPLENAANPTEQDLRKIVSAVSANIADIIATKRMASQFGLKTTSFDQAMSALKEVGNFLDGIADGMKGQK